MKTVMHAVRKGREVTVLPQKQVGQLGLRHHLASR